MARGGSATNTNRQPATGHWKLETSCKSCQISFCFVAKFVKLHISKVYGIKKGRPLIKEDGL
ncbi:MAG: hypothetical protein BWK74_04895 [Desulfobacteraceae bacterium A6]|nr:MAG: hypothetical protein BWK74_04895 [Desulfobacteraceae bacterium A6]